jgi:hypothetical protein
MRHHSHLFTISLSLSLSIYIVFFLAREPISLTISSILNSTCNSNEFHIIHTLAKHSSIYLFSLFITFYIFFKKFMLLLHHRHHHHRLHSKRISALSLALVATVLSCLFFFLFLLNFRS